LKGLENKTRLFWMLQVFGWFLFAAVFCLLDGLTGRFTAKSVVDYGSAAVAGFLATLLLRLALRKTKIRGRSLVTLSLLAVGYAILAANILIGLAVVLRYPFWGPRALVSFSSLMAYLLRLARWLTWLLAWSALYLGFRFWHEWAVQKERTEKAMALAQTAHLHMLRYRISPHFLFNALNSIRALIAENKTAAKSMVTELSEYLRYSLLSRNYENVPLREEIESLRHYLNIQKMRYENKLDVSFAVDPAVEEFPIASFLLHPLAENAVKHGLSTSPLPLRIRVQAGSQQGNLYVQVSNSGSWIDAAGGRKAAAVSSGLAIVRQRLADAYPGRHRFEVTAAEGIVRARLVIEKEKSE
jgi:two-component system LytT family sensor kinase